jgi:hypothetical protein
LRAKILATEGAENAERNAVAPVERGSSLTMNCDEVSTIEDSADAAWVKAQRERVTQYLAREGAKRSGVSLEPRWFVSPYVAVWAIRSRANPDVVGWWAISGDLPTDYMTCGDERNAGDILIAFATRWREAAKLMALGQQPEDFSIGGPEHAKELASLLAARAELLHSIGMELRSGDSPDDGRRFLHRSSLDSRQIRWGWVTLNARDSRHREHREPQRWTLPYTAPPAGTTSPACRRTAVRSVAPPLR